MTSRLSWSMNSARKSSRRPFRCGGTRRRSRLPHRLGELFRCFALPHRLSYSFFGRLQPLPVFPNPALRCGILFLQGVVPDIPSDTAGRDRVADTLSRPVERSVKDTFVDTAPCFSATLFEPDIERPQQRVQLSGRCKAVAIRHTTHDRGHLCPYIASPIIDPPQLLEYRSFSLRRVQSVLSFEFPCNFLRAFTVVVAVDRFPVRPDTDRYDMEVMRAMSSCLKTTKAGRRTPYVPCIRALFR